MFVFPGSQFTAQQHFPTATCLYANLSWRLPGSSFRRESVIYHHFVWSFKNCRWRLTLLVVKKIMNPVTGSATPSSIFQQIDRRVFISISAIDWSLPISWPHKIEVIWQQAPATLPPQLKNGGPSPPPRPLSDGVNKRLWWILSQPGGKAMGNQWLIKLMLCSPAGFKCSGRCKRKRLGWDLRRSKLASRNSCGIKWVL